MMKQRRGQLACDCVQEDPRDVGRVKEKRVLLWSLEEFESTPHPRDLREQDPLRADTRPIRNRQLLDSTTSTATAVAFIALCLCL